MPETPAVNEPLYSILGSDPDLGGIVEMFVDEMPGRISTLLQQLEESNWEELRRTAHQLKGAAGSYGFDAISPCAAKLEDSVVNHEPEEQIRESVNALVALCRRTRAGAPE